MSDKSAVIPANAGIQNHSKLMFWRNWIPGQARDDNGIFIFGMIFLCAFRFWNAFHFNPYWGYDGGGHLDYVFSLAAGHWPDIATNYIAWHEPLYYLIMGLVAKIYPSLRALEVAQALLSLAVAWLSWKVVARLTDKPWAQGMSWIVWNLLPPVVLASTMVTNELLNYFFLLLILYLGVSRIKFGMTTRGVVAIGIVCGLALLTKITAFVAILALAISLFREPKRALAILGIAGLLYTPWVAYKFSTGQSPLAINNTSYLAPAPLALDSRLKFFLKFDTDIFEFPFWYSGGRGFWSMIYADTFWDYYGMMQNRDDQTSRVPTDHNGGSVPTSKLEATTYLPYLALPLALVMLIGAWQLAKHPLQLFSLFSFLSLAALLYFSYRYPFYDRGIVKSIFIGPAFLPLLAAGFVHIEEYSKKPRLIVIFSLLVAAYLIFLLRSMALG